MRAKQYLTILEGVFYFSLSDFAGFMFHRLSVTAVQAMESGKAALWHIITGALASALPPAQLHVHWEKQGKENYNEKRKQMKALMLKAFIVKKKKKNLLKKTKKNNSIYCK